MNDERGTGQLKVEGDLGRKTLLATLLLIAAVGGVLYLTLPPREPSYNGKPLSYWLRRFEEGGSYEADTNNPKATESKAAIMHIGTNGIPTLLRMLQARDSAIKLKLMDLAERQHYIDFHFSDTEERNGLGAVGLVVLGDAATNTIPALIRIYKNPPSPSSKDAADGVLQALYPVSEGAIPYWIPADKRAMWCNDAGSTKFEFGAHSNAIIAYSEAIKLDPTNGNFYAGRASAKVATEDFNGALADLRKSVEFGRKDENTLFLTGVCDYELKNYTSADADFAKAIAANTNYSVAYDYRGAARMELRKFDDALADFNTAIELNSRDAEAYRDRAMVETVHKEYESALVDVSKSIELNGRDASAFVTRGRIKSSLKDYDGAIPDFDRAIELNPKNPTAFYSRGAVNVYRDDFDSATEDLQRALQLDPKSVPAYVYRGILEAKRGGGNGLVPRDLEHAVELAPQMPETHAVLGLFQYRFSQRPQALENCRMALELGDVGGTTDLRAYIWLIRAQNGEEADANRVLEAHLKDLKGAESNAWDASVARFLSGNLAESNFLSQATTTAKRPSDVRSQVCESLYYAGMKHKLAGDKQGASELFQKCVETKDDNNFGFLNANVELQGVKTD